MNAMRTLLRSTLAQAAVQDPIAEAAMHDFLGAPYGRTSNFANTSIRYATGPDGRRTRALNQHLASGTWGMPGGLGNGTGIALSGTPLAAPYYEASIEYDIRFVGAGRWPWGGKMPGLGGKRPGHGSPPGGGKVSPLGWSGRLMFRRNNADPTTAHLVGYVYDPLQETGSVGQDRQTGVLMQWNTWYHIRQDYRMNSIYTEGTNPKADGVHRISVDGKVCYETQSQVFRLWYDAKINHLMWDIFCGGNTAQWCPPTDLDVQTTNLLITTPQ